MVLSLSCIPAGSCFASEYCADRSTHSQRFVTSRDNGRWRTPIRARPWRAPEEGQIRCGQLGVTPIRQLHPTRFYTGLLGKHRGSVTGSGSTLASDHPRDPAHQPLKESRTRILKIARLATTGGNAYGENDKSYRRNIPLRKRLVKKASLHSPSAAAWRPLSWPTWTEPSAPKSGCGARPKS